MPLKLVAELLLPLGIWGYHSRYPVFTLIEVKKKMFQDIIQNNYPLDQSITYGHSKTNMFKWTWFFPSSDGLGH